MPTEAPTTDEVAPEPASETPSPVSTLTSVGTIDYESDGGYSWTVEPKFGAVISASDPSVDQALVQQCNADPETAGFIPMEVVTTSTTTGFSEDTAFSFTMSDSSDIVNGGGTGSLGGGGISWASELGSGPDCQSASPSDAAKWTITHSQLAPGASTTLRGGIVIDDWKTPDYPDGDPYYNGLWICQRYISDQFTARVTWTVRDASGPGMVVSDQARIGGASGPSRYAFPISGG